MGYRIRPLTAAIAVIFSGAGAVAHAQTPVLDSIVVSASREAALPAASGSLDTSEIASKRAFTSDAASLLSDVPGVSFYGSGGVSSLPVIRGLNDDRIRIHRLNPRL
jgi:iron complex outermembrane receptor protein